jgi:ABC-type xylose transport system permease subunit
MKRLRHLSTVSIVAILSALAVLIYNTWSICCGVCSISGLLTISPICSFLLALVGLAAVVLFSLRYRRKQRNHDFACSCGTATQSGWGYCPSCGRSFSA